jgi:hypothetical protein
MKRHRFHPATLAKIILIAASRRAFDRETMRRFHRAGTGNISLGARP